MASITLYPSGAPAGSNDTWSSVSNAYDGADTSSAASLTFGRLATTTMYGFLSIDTSAVPDGSTIDSVSVTTRISIKADYAKGSNGSWTSCGAALCAGDTEKGTLQELSANNTDTTLTMSGSSWTLEELRDLRVKYSYTTSSYGNQDSAAVMTVYGATATITYTLGVQYTVTVQVGEGITVDKDESTSVAGGSGYSVTITPEEGTTVSTVTDNGADVMGKLESRTPQTGGDITSNPTAYATSGSSISGTRYRNCIGKGSSTTATGNDYCSSRNSTATITYSFDFSDIPEDAIIESVEVVVGGHLENASSSTANLQLYSGSTAKGSQTKFTSTSKQLITMTPGTWTRAELQDAKLSFTIGYYGGLVNGVDFKVTYSMPSTGVYYIYTIPSVDEDHVIRINMDGGKTTLFVKLNGQWKDITAVYRKTNGAWSKVEPDTLDRTAKYIKKG